MLFNKFAIFLLISASISVISEGSTLTVGQGGKYDFENIQDAIWSSRNGDEIVVTPGVYTSAWNNVIVDTQGKSIWLYSSQGSSVTIIDGMNVSRGILCQNNETSETRITGFTIRNCKADGGGGAYFSHASPTITDCIFEDNVSEESYYYTANGGAILCNASSPIISECAFIYNNAEYNGGGVYNKNFSSPSILNCTFYGNASLKGGAICNSSSSDAIITDCSFQYNYASFYGGAVYLLDYCSVTMTNCSSLYNTSQLNGGGVYNQGGELIVTQCIFSQNYSNEGGGAGISINGGTATITQSEFKDNIAPSGAGINIAGGSSVVSIGETFFCGNYMDHVSGNWNDIGGNEFFSNCELGACCTNNICIPIDQKTCLYVGGDFHGLGTQCIDVVCQTVCYGDINGDNVVDASDLLSLIGVWGACP